MLHIITGKARSGKTSSIYSEIHRAVQMQQGGRILLVPEQYSHEAERELCEICGDTLSLYAEVLSFTGLARKVASALGGISVAYLDDGGRTLCMAQAMKLIGSSLEVFCNAAAKPELQRMLIAALDTMKASCITPADLSEAAEHCDEALARKLQDIAAIGEAYETVLGNSQADPGDRLARLAGSIENSSVLANSVVYVDGFIDFTKTELSVLTAMLKKGMDLTVCLTMEKEHTNAEIFALSQHSAGKLEAVAKELGIPVERTHFEEPLASTDPLCLFRENTFAYTGKTFSSDGKIQLFRAENMAAECELAAAKVLELVRDSGCRWRDIAVAIRGFDEYAPLLESTFEDYGIPLFTARRSNLKTRPLPSLISAAYNIIHGGWKCDDVVSYMGTGLTGLTSEECDVLSSYLFLWEPDERAWRRKSPWRQPPDGYGKKQDEKTEARLQEINRLREKLSGPLLQFAKACRAADTVAGQAKALSSLLDRLEISSQLSDKAEQLWNAGRKTDADEYRQLWEVIISALEQSVAVLGDSPMHSEEFARLFLLTISQYDIGLIPASLDAVSAGDFDRMRRRHIRNLLILGANDARLPSLQEETGIFSEEERRLLHRSGTELGTDPDLELWREYTLIYNCISLPTDSLILSYPALDAEGEEARPSLLVTRAERLFNLKTEKANREAAMLCAENPAFRLAAAGKSLHAKAAEAFFLQRDPERLRNVRRAAAEIRLPLSPASVEALYGKKLRLNASRAEKFFSCKYAFFCEHGLQIREHRKAEFSPADYGTFVHFVLQHTLEAVLAGERLQHTDDAAIRALACTFIQQYEEEVLSNFAEKNERFTYLFKRAEEDVLRTVLDTARELRKTSFTPLAFELNFGDRSLFPPLRLKNARDSVLLTGVADRVDGWENNGTVYVRVIDYKTGEKKFSFSDVWYGMSLQLILYLLALEGNPSSAASALKLPQGTKIRPAGAAYQQAKSKFVSLDRQSDEAAVQKEHQKNLRRSGFVLGSDGVPDAWETGEEKIYSPLKTKKTGEATGDALLTAEEIGLLFNHTGIRLNEMAELIRSGVITADPCRMGNDDPCCRLCSMNGLCGFEDGLNGEACRLLPERKKEAVLEAMGKEALADV
ncbi:MAG: PD-(D/E)XK nuclease family protein [Oscillospiraceae bacterium]|nr:PD-(D/E)XK nuclease family protein [Oscillospiraceae bacterium]